METTDWRARRGKTAHRVRREGTAIAVSYPYSSTPSRRWSRSQPVGSFQGAADVYSVEQFTRSSTGALGGRSTNQGHGGRPLPGKLNARCHLMRGLELCAGDMTRRYAGRDYRQPIARPNQYSSAPVPSKIGSTSSRTPASRGTSKRASLFAEGVKTCGISPICPSIGSLRCGDMRQYFASCVFLTHSTRIVRHVGTSNIRAARGHARTEEPQGSVSC